MNCGWQPETGKAVCIACVYKITMNPARRKDQRSLGEYMDDVVMREAALAITHGGHGTVTKALLHGLPQLVIPHGRDQVDNAVRVTHRGAGLTLDPSADTAALRAAIQRLLDEPGFTAQAVALGARIREEAEARCGASRLEALASLNTCRAA